MLIGYSISVAVALVCAVIAWQHREHGLLTGALLSVALFLVVIPSLLSGDYSTGIIGAIISASAGASNDSRLADVMRGLFRDSGDTRA